MDRTALGGVLTPHLHPYGIGAYAGGGRESRLGEGEGREARHRKATSPDEGVYVVGVADDVSPSIGAESGPHGESDLVGARDGYGGVALADVIVASGPVSTRSGRICLNHLIKGDSDREWSFDMLGRNRSRRDTRRRAR